MQELATRNREGEPLRRLLSLQGTRHHDFCDQLPCGFLHPGRDCFPNFFAFLPQAYLRALPVYAPVYILPAILVHRYNLLKVGGPMLTAHENLLNYLFQDQLSAVWDGKASLKLWAL